MKLKMILLQIAMFLIGLVIIIAIALYGDTYNG